MTRSRANIRPLSEWVVGRRNYFYGKSNTFGILSVNVFARYTVDGGLESFSIFYSPQTRLENKISKVFWQ